MQKSWYSWGAIFADGSEESRRGGWHDKQQDKVSPLHQVLSLIILGPCQAASPRNLSCLDTMCGRSCTINVTCLLLASSSTPI